MSTFHKMSESEAAVMQILWSSGENMTSARIIHCLREQKNWKPSTVWTFLGRLVEKDLIKAQRVGKINFYSPVLTERQYLQQETVQFLETVHNGSVQSLVEALLDASHPEFGELEELRVWLAKQKANIL